MAGPVSSPVLAEAHSPPLDKLLVESAPKVAPPQTSIPAAGSALPQEVGVEATEVSAQRPDVVIPETIQGDKLHMATHVPNFIATSSSAVSHEQSKDVVETAAMTIARQPSDTVPIAAPDHTVVVTNPLRIAFDQLRPTVAKPAPPLTLPITSAADSSPAPEVILSASTVLAEPETLLRDAGTQQGLSAVSGGGATLTKQPAVSVDTANTGVGSAPVVHPPVAKTMTSEERAAKLAAEKLARDKRIADAAIARMGKIVDPNQIKRKANNSKAQAANLIKSGTVEFRKIAEQVLSGGVSLKTAAMGVVARSRVLRENASPSKPVRTNPKTNTAPNVMKGAGVSTDDKSRINPIMAASSKSLRTTGAASAPLNTRDAIVGKATWTDNPLRRSVSMSEPATIAASESPERPALDPSNAKTVLSVRPRGARADSDPKLGEVVSPEKIRMALKKSNREAECRPGAPQSSSQVAGVKGAGRKTKSGARI